MYSSFITLQFTGLSILWGNAAGRNVRIKIIYIKISMQQKAKKREGNVNVCGSKLETCHKVKSLHRHRLLHEHLKNQDNISLSNP